MIPSVEVEIKSGGLGSIADTTDGVAGLVIGCDPADSGISAGDTIVLYGIDDAKTNNLDKIPYAYQQIAEFYNEAGMGAKLYVLIVENTKTLTEISDKADADAYAKKLLDYSGGTISLLGICRMPAEGYTPTVTKGLDNDSISALTKLQALAEEKFGLFTPFVGIIEGRDYKGVSATLDDLTTASFDFCGITMSCSDELHTIDAKGASVGLLLGRAAKSPVQRKIARVKDGSLSVTGVYYGASKLEDTDTTSIANKGYITIGTYANKDGYYYFDDTLATDQTGDFKCIANRRVMNKEVRIVYGTYINELNDDIELSSEGKLSPATAKYYQGLIANAVNNQMTANGEISSFSAMVDINQNVLSTGKIVIETETIPKGYSQKIKVVLGFSNPAISV